MGTSGSYSGSGDKPGRDIQHDIGDWLDSLPDTPSQPVAPEPGEMPSSDLPELPKIPEKAVLNVIPMFRPRSKETSGDKDQVIGKGRAGGGRRGGAKRSAARSSSSAGRATAAAYALRTGNREVLEQLGLDYDDLLNKDQISITQRIIEVACGPLSDGTIEDEERRTVAAEIVQWLLVENGNNDQLELEEIVRETIARIMFQAMLSESAALLRDGKRPAWASIEGERQILESARVLADQAELSSSGPSAEEFEHVIEQGIETLRVIWETSQ